MTNNLKQRRKKFIALMLTFVLAFSALQMPERAYAGGSSHSYDPTTHVCSCGAHEACNGTTPHEGWFALTQAALTQAVVDGSYPLQKEHYDFSKFGSENLYLAEDITLAYPIGWDYDYTTVEKTVNLCLNGHKINCGEKQGIVFNVKLSVLNIFDCGNVTRYFTDTNNDGCFETYNDSFDPTGKTEGTDYICTNGGVIYNSDLALEVKAGAQVNLYNIAVVGCKSVSINNPYIIHISDRCDNGTTYIGSSLNMINSAIKGNYSSNDAINNQTNLSILDGSCLEYNTSKRSIIGNDVESNLVLSNCAIRNNKLAFDSENYFLNSGVSCWENELNLNGDVIIADNIFTNSDYPDGIQKNLLFVDGNLRDVPFSVANLTTGSKIGISVQSELPSGGETVVCTDLPSGLSSLNLFSDSSLYFLDPRDNTLILKNRLLSEPSLGNNYSCAVADDGMTASYQWYTATLVTTPIDETLPESYVMGSYADQEWQPVYESEYGCWGYFNVDVQEGQRFRAENDFSEDICNGDSFISTYDVNDLIYTLTYERIRVDGETVFNFKHSGTYFLEGGCFGETATAADLKLKNARLETLTLNDAIAGQTTDSLTITTPGTYVCEISLTDANGNTKKVLSNPVIIEMPDVLPPTANTLTYNGSAQTLAVAGGAKYGTMMYALGADAVTAPTDGWSESVPFGTDAGTYYLWYKTIGNPETPDTDPEYIEVTIAPLDISAATVGSFASMTYNGSTQTPAAEVTVNGISATGSWSPVVNVADTTDFTANGNFTGTISGRTTGMLKGEAAAPAGLSTVKTSEYGCADGKITGTSAEMEYSTTSSFDTAEDCTGAEVTGLTAGTYYVRYKETANTTAGEFTSAVVSEGSKENFNITVTNYSSSYDGAAHGISLSGVPAGAVVKYGIVNGTYDRDSVTYSEYTGGYVTVYFCVTMEGYNNYYGSGTVNIYKAYQPTPSGLAGVNASAPGVSDGKITGTNYFMEYSTSPDFLSASACLYPETTGLLAGTYYVRFKETDNYSASSGVGVIIAEDKAKEEDKDKEEQVIEYTIPVKGDGEIPVVAEISDGKATLGEISEEELMSLFTKKQEKSGKTEDSDKSGEQGDSGEAGSAQETEKAHDKDEKKIVIDLSESEQKVNSATISAKSIKSIAAVISNDQVAADSAEIKLSEASVTMDASAVKALSDRIKDEEGSKVQLVVRDNALENLNTAQQEALKVTDVLGAIDAHIECGGKEIHNFGGGSIKVAVNFDIPKGKDPKHFFMEYVSESGVKERYTTGYDGKRIIFVTSHFSDFVIVYDNTAENESDLFVFEEAATVINTDVPYLKMSKVIGLGNKFTIKLTGLSEDAEVKFTSSNENVATVDENGVIKAEGLGTSTIKGVVEQNGNIYEYVLSVKVKDTGKGNRQIKDSECADPDSAAPVFNVYKAVKSGNNIKLRIKNADDSAKITWESEDDSIAAVSENGVVTGVAKGYTGINVYVEQDGYTCQYRVAVRVCSNK